MKRIILVFAVSLAAINVKAQTYDTARVHITERNYKPDTTCYFVNCSAVYINSTLTPKASAPVSLLVKVASANTITQAHTYCKQTIYNYVAAKR
ncbi:MAG TPA: hypothetical protein VK808_01115 [Bacteroidia bacterium]|nr:hypothetical protein [Bacteroidia bacterium]